MSQISKIVITGANGFIAKNLRRYLSKQNVKMVSISRTDFPIFKNESKIISKNYDNLPLSKFQDSKAIIHLVGIGKQTVENEYNSINFEITKKIVEFAKNVRIKKIIYLSGLGVTPKTTLGYFISKLKAENEIISSGIDYTIFRPSYIVGKNDQLTKYLNSQIKHGIIKIPGSGNYNIQPISINDASKIIFEATKNKQFRKKILDLVGPELITFGKYVKLFSKNSKAKIQKIPLEQSYHQAIVNPKNQFGVDDLNLLVRNFKGDFKKLQKIYGQKFYSIKDILKTSNLS